MILERTSSSVNLLSSFAPSWNPFQTCRRLHFFQCSHIEATRNSSNRKHGWTWNTELSASFFFTRRQAGRGGGAVPMVISRSATKMEYTPCTVNAALRHGCLPHLRDFLLLRRAGICLVGCPQAYASVRRIAEDTAGVRG